jgi:S-adenosylmethionine hydrolase
LISNIAADLFSSWQGQPVQVTVGDRPVPRLVRAYAEAEPGSLVALVSSAGLLEVAVNQGSAARRLQAGVGTPLTITALSARSES